ncbi:MAG: hypothetical protein HY736_12920 [Verrucomicrobia bacterium]|nr:hypothetical protein [Verrucomicrobiota bacterium]
MLGWFADLFRLAWGLFYWNTRKAWFQWRRGRARCPCQNPSDSGRAFETGCEACVSWSRQVRFRRVCPLLVETPDGLRCAANTADVRPFWGIAAGYYGGALLSVYAVVVLTIFIFLRTVGYPVSILHVGLPPLWHKVGQARGWFFLDRSNRAFAAGKTAEGLLYLANSYDFDPTNVDAGLALAKHFQAAHPARSDEIFKKLLRDHPGKRAGIAQDWFRALLARGDFEKIAPLAQAEILTDTVHAGVWIRALLFATRRTGYDGPLRALLANHAPAAVPWHPVIETELLLRAGRPREARAALERPWPGRSPPFSLFYRVNALIDLKDTFAALDLLARHPRALDPEAEVTLRLDAFAERNAKGPLQRQLDELLVPRLNLATLKIICAHLIRHPDAAIFDRLYAKVGREPIPFGTETAGAWFSLLCTAGAVGDRARLSEITERLKTASRNPFVALDGVAAFFRGETGERRITLFLPILPLPLEVTYALIERYSPVPAIAEPGAPRSV